jgi:hypothetical protein
MALDALKVAQMTASELGKATAIGTITTLLTKMARSRVLAKTERGYRLANIDGTNSPSTGRSVAVFARGNPHDRHLFAGARIRIYDVRPRTATKPRLRCLADEDGLALRAVSLLDPDRLTLAPRIHASILP